MAAAAALPISVPVTSAEICPLVMQIFVPRPEARRKGYMAVISGWVC
jgi:hypothetical protein